MALPRISICVITGNEAETIERFLESFRDAFDELCLVRAIGNQEHDRTLSIAKEWCRKQGKAFVAGIYENKAEKPAVLGVVDNANPASWPHVDDFAAARNVAWGMATCPWQFWADVDDLLVPATAEQPGGAELIRLCAAADTHDHFFFKYDLRGQAESNVRERLFRRGISQWVQPVHEQCRLIDDPSLRLGRDGVVKPYRGLIEERVVYEHAPLVEKKRDPQRNRRIMEHHTRWIHAYAFELHREWFYDWQMLNAKAKAGIDGASEQAAKAAEEATRWAELAHQTNCIPEQRFDLLLHQAAISSEHDVEHAIDLCWSAIRISPKNRNGWGDLAKYELAARRGGRAVMATEFLQSLPKPKSGGYQLGERYYGWEGAHLRARALRASGNEAAARRHEDSIFEQSGKRISLLHATRGRPDKALETRNLWFKSAFTPLGVEHIFAIDADDTASLAALKDYRHVVVSEPRGCVKAWNAAAAASSGQVLLQLSDDWTPCHDWDFLIWEALAGRVASDKLKPAKELTPEEIGGTPLVLAIHDGHRTDALLCMAILTRARYEHAGLFHPDYFGVFSDNEFTVRAYDDGVVVQAQHIVFTHEHPVFGKAAWDATYKAQNDPARYAEGAAIFNRRNPSHAVAVTADAVS